MTDRKALLRQCERDIRRIVQTLDAASAGQNAALHLVWAADLLKLELTQPTKGAALYHSLWDRVGGRRDGPPD